MIIVGINSQNIFVKQVALVLALVLTIGLITTSAVASTPLNADGDNLGYTQDQEKPEAPGGEPEDRPEQEIESEQETTQKLLTQQSSLPMYGSESRNGVIQLIEHWDGEFYPNSHDITKNKDCIKCACNSGKGGNDAQNGIEWVVEDGGRGVRITFTKDQNYDTVVLNMSKYAMAFFYTRNFMAGDILYADGTKAVEKAGNNGEVSYFLLKKMGTTKPPVEPEGKLTISKTIAGGGAQDGTFSFIIYDSEGEPLEIVKIATQNGTGRETLDYNYGDYTIVEDTGTEPDGEFPYDVTYDPEDGKVTVGYSEVGVAVLNTLKTESRGSITVFKTIEGEEFEDEETESGEFTFIITDADSEEYELIVATNGGIGQNTLENIPFGVYSIAEKDSELDEFPYDVEISGGGVAEIDREFPEAEIIVVNTLKKTDAADVGSITIIKTIVGEEFDDKDAESGEFTFIITAMDIENSEDSEEYELIVETKGGVGHNTLADVPFGIYSIVEKDSELDDFPYDVEISGSGMAELSEETPEAEVIVVNAVKVVVPSVTLSVVKHVRNAAGNWANSADFTNGSTQVDFRIIVSLNVDKLIAFNEKHKVALNAYVSGYLSDLLDGSSISLPDNGEFNLYYNGEDDNALAKTFSISQTLDIGSHTNVVTIEEAIPDFFGELKVANGSASASVVISETITFFGGGGGGGDDVTTFIGGPPTITPIDATLEFVPTTVTSEPYELIEDEAVPLVRSIADEQDVPDETNIDDEPVPLVNMPQTGESNSILLWILALCASLALTVLSIALSSHVSTAKAKKRSGS